jgi:nitrate reductase NapE component
MKNKKKLSEEEQGVRRETVLKLITLILVTAGIFAVYRISVFYELGFVFWVYLVALTALVAVYIIYNRGMSSKGVSADMLPDEWSYEEKVAFIENVTLRRRRSSWMLMLIMAFIFTFAFDLLELYALPYLEEILK